MNIFLDLFLTFFKIGLFTFGGGYSMIPMIQDEVIKKGWLSLDQLINFIGISESTPGPFAINISTFIGSNQAGFLGGVCATIGVVLPSFLIILLIAKVFVNFQNNDYVKNTLFGIKAVVCGLIFVVIFNLLKTNLQDEIIMLPFIIILTILLIIKIIFKKINPILLIGLSAVLGMIITPLVG